MKKYEQSHKVRSEERPKMQKSKERENRKERSA
jgi:hypothetical protein